MSLAIKSKIQTPDIGISMLETEDEVMVVEHDSSVE